MWQGSYGKEPFDFRLTVLRFLRNLGKIVVLTLVGTLIFGGGYYVKNVLLGPKPQYSATSTYKVEYVNPPMESGDYYINEMTWNTLVQSAAFLAHVQSNLMDVEVYGGNGENTYENYEKLEMSTEELAAAISAKLPSDWNIPTTTVIYDDPEKAVRIADAVERAMKEELANIVEEVKDVTVIDSDFEAQEVELDVRPTRAFVLSALLSFFFVSVIFLLKEMGDDSIWLPATLRRRYGLKVVGTLESPELDENIRYLFKDMENIGVCSVDSQVDVTEVAKALEEKGKQWIPVPSPILCPEGCEKLRKMGGILLVVQAGSHAGKPLEYVMEYLAQQDCGITAALLWNADETLIKAYYGFGKGECQT